MLLYSHILISYSNNILNAVSQRIIKTIWLFIKSLRLFSFFSVQILLLKLSFISTEKFFCISFLEGNKITVVTLNFTVKDNLFGKKET